MPPVSQAQRALMAMAAKRKGGYRGVPQSVGRDFIDADKGGKLPKHVKPKTKSKRR